MVLSSEMDHAKSGIMRKLSLKGERRCDSQRIFVRPPSCEIPLTCLRVSWLFIGNLETNWSGEDESSLHFIKGRIRSVVLMGATLCKFSVPSPLHGEKKV
jgi:hypothetical protein